MANVYQTSNSRVQIIQDGDIYRVMLDNSLYNTAESLGQAEYIAQKLIESL